MIRVSKGLPCKNIVGLGQNTMFVTQFCWDVEKKFPSSTCVHYLTGFVGCRIKFCTEWCQFQRDCLEKIRGFGPKYCFCPVLLVYLAKLFCSTYAHRLITFFGSRIQFCIEWSEFQKDCLVKILWVWMKILCFDPVLLVCLEEICFFDLCSPSNCFGSIQNLILNPPKPIWKLS
jgi:hypothetical protein